jgi:AraC-like DNA-binding protein
MKVTHPIISDRVSAYVKGIFIIENDQNNKPFMLPLFANGTPTLVFQTTKGQLRNQSNYLTLFGQTVAPEQLYIDGEFTLIAYFLTPHTLSSLFGLKANELTDNPIDLNLLSNNCFLEEQLLHAKTIKDTLSLLDDYIFGLIMKTRADVKSLNYAARIIARKPFGNVLSEVQNELGFTERTFQRLFERTIGVSPNQFRRINQFHNAFGQLNNKQFENLSDIAIDNGFVDQSHFIRTFREFTQITPSVYLNNRNLS